MKELDEDPELQRGVVPGWEWPVIVDNTICECGMDSLGYKDTHMDYCPKYKKEV